MADFDNSHPQTGAITGVIKAVRSSEQKFVKEVERALEDVLSTRSMSKYSCPRTQEAVESSIDRIRAELETLGESVRKIQEQEEKFQEIEEHHIKESSSAEDFRQDVEDAFENRIGRVYNSFVPEISGDKDTQPENNTDTLETQVIHYDTSKSSEPKFFPKKDANGYFPGSSKKTFSTHEVQEVFHKTKKKLKEVMDEMEKKISEEHETQKKDFFSDFITEHREKL